MPPVCGTASGCCGDCRPQDRPAEMEALPLRALCALLGVSHVSFLLACLEPVKAGLPDISAPGRAYAHYGPAVRSGLNGRWCRPLERELHLTFVLHVALSEY